MYFGSIVFSSQSYFSLIRSTLSLSIRYIYLRNQRIENIYEDFYERAHSTSRHLHRCVVSEYK